MLFNITQNPLPPATAIYGQTRPSPVTGNSQNTQRREQASQESGTRAEHMVGWGGGGFNQHYCSGCQLIAETEWILILGEGERGYSTNVCIVCVTQV